MKFTKSQFVQLIKESYVKQKTRQLTEVEAATQRSGETQGDVFSDEELGKMLADPKAILRMINNRLQGKMEFKNFGPICLEFILDFKGEGANETDLMFVCKQVAGDSEGVRLYNMLKRIAKTFQPSSEPVLGGKDSSDPDATE